MQFIQNGPEIPDELLLAHEEGRVVFFCGAGISYPAGLPGFQGLVDKIYSGLGAAPSDIEKQAYSRSQFDATLDLLERRIAGRRFAVRKALRNALQPNLRLKGATATHSALLTLGRCRDGAVRLVTTNFDRVFDHLIKRQRLGVPGYAAPTLPIPKNSRWNGLVYLHGLLPDTADESALNRLVITSGDFGLAYLTERWAARFVGELFRNYIVCFVGYSINDPVLRYMMDALAADRMLGEVTPQAYAFGDCHPGQELEKNVEWEAKGVTPILYEVPVGTHDHSALHRTLSAWAETHRDGVQGRERIVVNYALTRPSASTRQDDFVGRMLWALAHESGVPAKRFAEFDPAPSLDWLTPFGENRYRHRDLRRFGVQPRAEVDAKLEYSLIRRPGPYTRTPWMALVSTGPASCEWDDVMFQLGRWLCRHLGDPTLVLWVATWGGQLHPRLAWQIERELDRLAKLEAADSGGELDRVRANAPKALPDAEMRVLWRLLLTGRVAGPGNEFGLYDWKDRLARDGATPSLRMELRGLLAPRVKITKAIRWVEDEGDDEAFDGVRQVVDCELVLCADSVHSAIVEISKSAQWPELLTEMVDDFQLLLRDAVGLLKELGEADERNDRSHWGLPSISPHWQNRGFRDWTVLVELLRDAWDAVYRQDVTRAREIAFGWFAQGYPVFKRLALFAATHQGVTPEGEWVDWLLADRSWSLWSSGTQRETMRLLVLAAPTLPTDALNRLQAAIISGPPREMYKEEISEADWDSIVQHSTWVRLAKLASAGPILGREAQFALDGLSRSNPTWKLAQNERDEFSHWMTGTGDPDFEDHRQVDRAPRRRRELVAWLRRPPAGGAFYEDTWREICRERFFVAVVALRDLSRDGEWPAGRWREALQVWSEERLVSRSWRCVAPLLLDMPNDVLLKISHSVSWWIQAVAKGNASNQELFYELCRRVLVLNHKELLADGDYVSRAINHPVGHIAQALLDQWFRQELIDNQGLPNDLEALLSRICNVEVEAYRAGRVVLASRLITLFRVDRPWVEERLLPLFNWAAMPVEAPAMWDGFLWSPRIYRPLLAAFKGSFLETAQHYTALSGHRSQYAAFLTYVALDPADTFTMLELRGAIASLPQDGLREVTRALVQALEGAGEHREQYFSNRISPFWRDVWPKDRGLISGTISEDLARLAIAARAEFPAAVDLVQDWLVAADHPSFVVHQLNESGLAGRYAEPALRLLNAIVDRPAWVPRELGECLQAIAGAWADAERDSRYQRLLLLTRR